MAAPSTTTLDQAYGHFIDAYPSYLETTALDDIRDREFQRLDDQHLVYLDYTGGGLYPVSVVRQHADFLTTHVLGNPHSMNAPSVLAGAGTVISLTLPSACSNKNSRAPSV